MKRLFLLVSLLVSTEVLAAECVALKAMSEEPKELTAKRDSIQKNEWLLLAYLSSEPSRKKVFDKEVALSQQRVQMIKTQMDALAPLANTQIEQGSADCAKFEKFKRLTEQLVSDREKEIAAHHKKLSFLYSCGRISQSLMSHHTLMTSAADPQTKKFGAIALDAATGPFQMNAGLDYDDMKALSKEAEAPIDVGTQPRYAYFALACMKHSQKQESRLKPLAAIQDQLRSCGTNNWIEIGTCVTAAALQ